MFEAFSIGHIQLANEGVDGYSSPRRRELTKSRQENSAVWTWYIGGL